MAEAGQALDLLYVILRKLKDKTEISLLNNIIVKLERFEKGDYQHPDDLTKDEKYELELNNLNLFIEKNYNNDIDDFIGSVNNEGWEYFYYHYWDTIPGVSYETFRQFVKENED